MPTPYPVELYLPPESQEFIYSQTYNATLAASSSKKYLTNFLINPDTIFIFEYFSIDGSIRNTSSSDSLGSVQIVSRLYFGNDTYAYDAYKSKSNFLWRIEYFNLNAYEIKTILPFVIFDKPILLFRGAEFCFSTNFINNSNQTIFFRLDFCVFGRYFLDKDKKYPIGSSIEKPSADNVSNITIP